MVEQASEYSSLLACYLSGQMTERQWQEHLKDEAFAAWVRGTMMARRRDG